MAEIENIRNNQKIVDNKITKIWKDKKKLFD